MKQTQRKQSAKSVLESRCFDLLLFFFRNSWKAPANNFLFSYCCKLEGYTFTTKVIKISSSYQCWCMQAQALGWPGPVNENLGPGPVNTNWWTGPLNTNWRARAGKYKLGARAGKYKLAARTRGPENANKNKTRIKQEPYCIIPVTYNVWAILNWNWILLKQRNITDISLVKREMLWLRYTSFFL